jgi:predicted dehydrogenase
VALPILKQPEFIRKALSAGKHVLSEKPVAENIKDAEDLIKWYRSNIDTNKVTWGVAENFRFLNSFNYASGVAKDLGRVLNIRLHMSNLLQGGKYFETEWRKTPSHQGGFVLDAGVHFIAGLRQLLGPDTITSVSAFTTQNQKHLPPLDTLDGCVKTQSGGTGTVAISFGTTLTGSAYAVGYEKGNIVISSDHVGQIVKGKPGEKIMHVTTTIDGKTETKDITDEGTGVKPEVRAWGEGIVAGKPNVRQSPEQALADLEVVSYFPL